MALNTLYLVRHGHTIWHETGGIAGRTDIDLSDRGREAVRQLARVLGSDFRPDHWFCSPLARTRQTCTLLRQGVLDSPGGTIQAPQTAEPMLDKRLVELDFGDWEGLTWSHVNEHYEHQMQQWGADWINRCPPNGESFSQQVERCREWLADAQYRLRSVEPESGAVICHGGTIRALICHCLGWPLSRAMQFKVDPATVCELECSDNGRWLVRRINTTC